MFSCNEILARVWHSTHYRWAVCTGYAAKFHPLQCLPVRHYFFSRIAAAPTVLIAVPCSEPVPTVCVFPGRNSQPNVWYVTAESSDSGSHV